MVGEIGFDEGGVLKALNHPIIEHTIVSEKTSKKGKKTVSTTTFALTGAQIAFVAIILGFIKLKSLIGNVDVPDEVRETAEKMYNDNNGKAWLAIAELMPGSPANIGSLAMQWIGSGEV